MTEDARAHAVDEKTAKPAVRPLLSDLGVQLARQASRLPSLLSYAAEAVIALALLVELSVLFANVMIRWTTSGSLLWSDEVATLCLEVLAFVGGAVAYRRKQHLSIKVLSGRLSDGGARALEVLTDWLVFAVSAGLFVLSLSLLETASLARSPALGISQMWFMLPLTIGLALMGLFALERLVSRRMWAVVCSTAGITGAAILLLMALHRYEVSLTAVAPWLAICAFVILLLIGLPIGFTLAAVSLMYLYTSGTADPLAVPLVMQGSVNTFVLLAVPLFILAGFVMTAGGLSEPLGTFVRSLVGHIRGGLLQVIVVSMYIFSGISGAKTADVAAVGTTLKPALDQHGYDPNESVAVLSSSAVMGETVPPSVALLIMASISTLSVSSLFVAGFLPAAVIGVCLMLAIYVKARRSHSVLALERISWPNRAKYCVIALPALMVPFVLAGGILLGIATPTEVSSVGVVYAIVVSIVIYRQRDIRIFVALLKSTASMAGMILFIYSTANSLSWTTTAAGLATKIASILESWTHSQAVFLLGAVLLMIAMGALLEGIPALVVMAPLLFPLAVPYGVDPLHFGIVMIIAMGLGSFIPPLGLGVYVAAAIFETELETVTARMVPYLAVLFVGLLLVTFIPGVTLALPHLFHLH
jgi:tripartite ATP-independent transporter DctM subunit